MWIERIDFAGFGSISGEKIEFSNDKLNLVVEPNEYGKSTIANAIWSVLYGFNPTENAHPGKLSEFAQRSPSKESGLPFIASIDINTNGRRLKIIRDFNDNAVQVIDVGQANKDVTREFRDHEGRDSVGYRVCGMTRQMFRSTCFLGQGDLDEHLIVGDQSNANSFRAIADSATTSTNADVGIGAIETVLAGFPYGGRNQRLDVVIRDLEDHYFELSQKIRTLQSTKAETRVYLKEIENLEQQIRNNGVGQSPSDQYFALCLQAADLDNQLIRAQQRATKAQRAKEAKDESPSPQQIFSPDSLKSVADLWTRRQSRKVDYQKLFEEVAPRLSDYDAQFKSFREKWSGFETMTLDEAKQIGLLAVDQKKLLEELADLNVRRQVELDKVDGLEIDLREIDQTRKQIKNLQGRDNDDARSYAALLKNFREGLKDSEKAIAASQQVIDEIVGQKKSKKGIFVLPAGGRKKEVIVAEQEIAKQQKRMDELKSKIAGLDTRMDSLALKAGLTSGAQLSNFLINFESATSQLKDLENIDLLISVKDAELLKAKTELSALYQKAGRQQVDITPDTSINLAEELSRYFEESRAMNALTTGVKQYREQLDFLTGEIKDIEDFLAQMFIDAGIGETEDIDLAYGEYYGKYEAYRSSLGVAAANANNQLMDAEMQEMFAQIALLEQTRVNLWGSMQELVNRYPEIADSAPPMVSLNGPLGASDAAKQHLEMLRAQRDDLIVRVRSTVMNSDQNYHSTLEELEATGRTLHRLRRAKSALELARDTLKRLSQQTYVDWSSRLNEIAKKFMQEVRFEFESITFDQQLRLEVKRWNDNRPISTAQIENQLSFGAREQIHLVARLIMSRFLSKDNSLPIILDEPFSESDDVRFLHLMRFLIDKLSLHHQVIIFSCHQIRHQWLLSQLNDQQKFRLYFSRRDSGRNPPPVA